MNFQTAHLCDHFFKKIKVANPIFRSFGGRATFSGQINTVKVYDDCLLVQEIVNQPGQGKVLVVDGGGSLRCALVGKVIAQLAADKGWEGIIVDGCIRDVATLAQMNIGIKALNSYPLSNTKNGRGDHNVPVTFAGLTFFPKHYVYADADGIIVAESQLVSD
ncbi:MAG: putative 4-hydroxy-4-methyl-2-oxoglutarate aldolase [Candidatus Parabeggiatoa sp. nov. 3]|nr:MAG: putative 4-hydroxy-4-methyl-2-oxoglutarate aldolase [Gammaproteobacteria bacterium]RKZ58881.1 MAG: putative 4-hydroxy-4-methyl-2-oxoglutarate aldolase [Gammaproteobacteria bacterium]RKZ78865.1 MAG: putative 4-hydroxy-4-methyl-2-oxoglutarate aldolase [Gammaproteobacteria bacterium]HEW97045.1 RraA family protein [Beggiatoa sp.]